MLKRLLFVDDDAMVLAGLRRALHDMRQEWDMHFAPGAYAALQALEKERFDAVITDMRMPSMDGALLLDCIKDRYPQVVRIILSGQSEKEAVLRSIAPAHQYLAKPCDIRELKLRLNQAFASRDLVTNPAIAAAIARTALDPQLAGHLQRTDRRPALGDHVARANRADHRARHWHGVEDSSAGELRLHRRARPRIQSAPGGLADRDRDGPHPDSVHSRLLSVRQEIRGRQLPSRLVGSQCLRGLHRAAHRGGRNRRQVARRGVLCGGSAARRRQDHSSRRETEGVRRSSEGMRRAARVPSKPSRSRLWAVLTRN